MQVLRFSVFLIVIIAVSSVGSSAQNDETATVSGRITTLRGDPLADAIVQFYELEGIRGLSPTETLRKAVTTDSSGAYVAKGIPWGQYRVNVEVPTFGHTEVWRFYLWRNARRVLDIGVPIGITHGLSEITIEGTVSGENGKRLRDATVTIVNVYDSEETEQVRTDSNGSYKITRIQPGQYVLYAYYPGYGPTASTLDLGNGTKTSLDFSIKPVKRKALMEP